MQRLHLDFLGTRVRLTAEPGPALEELARDFSSFADPTPGPPDVNVRLCGESCPPPEGPWRWRWRDFATRPDGAARLVRWDDGAWARCEYGAEQVVVHAADDERRRELAYLAVLSRAGEALDRRGLHRVHALGLAGPRGAALVLLPSGGGKSTLALELLRRGSLRVLSDESPLVDRDGRVFPFPLRLALRPGADVAGLAASDLRTFRRRGYGAKTLVEPSALRAAAGGAAPARWLFDGTSSTGAPSVEPLSPARALSALAGPLVIGVGLAQMAEYMARADVALASIAASRARAALALARRTAASRLLLGSRGPAATADLLERVMGGRVRHVALLAPRPLYPERSGGEIRVATLLRRLSDRWRFTVLTLARPESRLLAEAAAAFVERSTGARVRLAWRTPGARVPDGLPAVSRDHADPAFERALEALAAQDPVDLVALEFTQLAQYARDAARLAPVVLTEHDSSVLRPADSYLRGAGAAPAERARVAAHLREAFGHCARVVAVSDADAARLAPLAGADKVAVVPTGVDLERFAFAPPAGRRAGEAVFVGHYPHYPNEEAAVRLCRDILPLMLKRAPVRLRLVGSGPTPAVRALAGPAVEVVGEVADVAPELRRARVFLAPMKLGFGIKGKVLEAFACGAPVVASPRACEAMPGLVPGEHLLVARDARSFAAAAVRLLEDDALAARLAAAARAYAQARFGWAAQADRLDAVYRAALREGKPCPA